MSEGRLAGTLYPLRVVTLLLHLCRRRMFFLLVQRSPTATPEVSSRVARVRRPGCFCRSRRCTRGTGQRRRAA